MRECGGGSLLLPSDGLCNNIDLRLPVIGSTWSEVCIRIKLGMIGLTD